jgi:hypothetical protein
MKATVLWLSALAGTGLTASITSAWTYCSPVLHVPLPAAPDACGPGFYTVCPNGTAFGPNYWLRPPCDPFNGHFKTVTMNAGQKMMADKLGIPFNPAYNPHLTAPYGSPAPLGATPSAFPTHPYVRGPRDFFMWRENMEDQMRRDQRPSLVP